MDDDPNAAFAEFSDPKFVGASGRNRFNIHLPADIALEAVMVAKLRGFDIIFRRQDELPPDIFLVDNVVHFYASDTWYKCTNSRGIVNALVRFFKGMESGSYENL